jgi:hypothetical protein
MDNHIYVNWLGFKSFLLIAIIGLILGIVLFSFPTWTVYAQQPTGSIPTVTGSPPGPFVTVYSDQNIVGVYAGPSSYIYDQIGILLSGEEAPALAYSIDGNWIQIVYLGVRDGKGWVYAPYVSISPGSLPKLPNPPTSTPRTTPTLDPTYVAAFGVELMPTQLPTFTPPPPLKLPTFVPTTDALSKAPFGFLIFGLVLVGLLGAIISFLRGNR